MKSIGPIAPFDAISLARELIGGAVASISAIPPPNGTMVSAPDIPTKSASVRLDHDGLIVVDLMIPPDVLFSFRLAPNVAGHLARELSAFLQAYS